MALIRANKIAALPPEYVVLLANAGGTSQWNYGTVPKEIVSHYTKITASSASGTLSNAKYGTVDTSGTIANHQALDSALTTSLSSGVAATLTGVTDDLVVGTYGADVGKIVLSN